MAVYPYYCGEGGGAVSPSVSQTHTVSPPVKACMGYSRQVPSVLRMAPMRVRARFRPQYAQVFDEAEPCTAGEFVEGLFGAPQYGEEECRVAARHGCLFRGDEACCDSTEVSVLAFDIYCTPPFRKDDGCFGVGVGYPYLRAAALQIRCPGSRIGDGKISGETADDASPGGLLATPFVAGQRGDVSPVAFRQQGSGCCRNRQRGDDQRRIRRLPYLFLSYRFHAVGGIRYYRSRRFVRRFVCCPLLCLSSDGIVIFQLPDVAGPENGERQSGCRSVVPFPHMGWKVSLLPFAVSVPSFREVLSLSFRCGASLRILR